MNSHESHAISEFDSFYMKNQIILLYIFSHVSHLLQSLNVSCFSALKQSYEQLIENQIQCDVNHMNKLDFLTLYSEAHKIIFNEQNIQSDFRATELISHASYEILFKLSVMKPSATQSIQQNDWFL